MITPISKMMTSFRAQEVSVKEWGGLQGYVQDSFFDVEVDKDFIFTGHLKVINVEGQFKAQANLGQPWDKDGITGEAFVDEIGSVFLFDQYSADGVSVSSGSSYAMTERRKVVSKRSAGLALNISRSYGTKIQPAKYGYAVCLGEKDDIIYICSECGCGNMMHEDWMDKCMYCHMPVKIYEE